MGKKKSKSPFIVGIMIGVGLGAGFVIGRIAAGGGAAIPPGQGVLTLLLLMPAYFLAVGLHEAGHAAAGAWMNFDLRMYVVGPFMWQKNSSGWRFKWNKNVNISGGLVIALPVTMEKLARRFSIYILGGAISSLLLAAIAFAGNRLFVRFNQDAAAEVIATFFSILAVLSLFIFLITMVPVRMGGFYTDGARALRFLRGGEIAQFEVLLMKIVTGSTAGVRPKLLNTDEIREAISLAAKLNSPMKVYLHSYLYQSAFDKENLEEAENHLQEYMAGVDEIPDGFKGSAFLDAAFFYALVRRDQIKAEEFWNQYKPSAVISKALVLATEAAMMSLQGNIQVASQKVEQAILEIPNMMDRGVAIALQDRLTQLKETLSVDQPKSMAISQ
jgi:hypothetical protein